MMARPILFLLILLCYGCKEKVAKLIVDNSPWEVVETYEYDYHNDKLISQNVTTSTYMGSAIVDRVHSMTHKDYDEKGRLLKSVSWTEIDSLFLTGWKKKAGIDTTESWYRYNSKDSLIEILSLEPDGDTSYWSLYDYFPDGKQVIKGVKPKINKQARYTENLVADLSFSFSRKYSYRNNICNKIEEYDGAGKLIQRTEKIYSKESPSRPVQTIFYYHESEPNPLFDSSVERKNIRYDNYAHGISNSSRYDFALLDANGDTLSLQISSFDKNGILYKKILIDNEAQWGLLSLFRNDTLQREITIAVGGNKNWIKDYFYYPNGRIKEIRSHREKIDEKANFPGRASL